MVCKVSHKKWILFERHFGLEFLKETIGPEGPERPERPWRPRGPGRPERPAETRETRVTRVTRETRDHRQPFNMRGETRDQR